MFSVVAQETSLYAGLKMQDVGKRSHYEEIQRYQNAPEMSPYEGITNIISFRVYFLNYFLFW